VPRYVLVRREHRALALLVGLAAVAAAAFGVVRWFEGARGRGAEDKAALERALAAAPDDARLHHRLGQWEQFSLAEGDSRRALAHFQRATELNPHESAYWLDLADARLFAGNAAGAEAAAAKALEVDPRTPRTLWRVGNFWLRTAAPARAFPYFRRVLETDPPLTPLVVQVCHRTFRDPEVLLRELLPPEPPFLLAYLRQLVREGDAEAPAAGRVWEKLVETGRPFEAREALFYLDYTIRTRHLAQAVKAWADLRRLRRLPGPAAAPELLHNPDLAAPILNGGFDWRIDAVAHVGVSLGPGRRGERPPAVIIRFSGEDNLYYRGFYQYAVVEPNRRYRFQAWLRTDSITTESGPRLEVVDVYAGGRLLGRSPGMVGTSEWAPEQVEFASGPETRLVRVGLTRLPSRRLGGEIRGAVFAGEFSLQPMGAR
jgi:hypothetical protein